MVTADKLEMSLRALVTGVAGFAGSHLAELLISRGAEVYGLVVPGGSLENLDGIRKDSTRAKHLHLIEADIVHEEQLVNVIAETRPEQVYHLAAVSSVRRSLEEPGEAFQVNVLGTRNLLETIRHARVGPRVLVVSSAEVYGESANLPRPLREEDPLVPVSPYGASKAAAEMTACRYWSEYGLHIVRVRPFPHTGPRHSPQFVLPDWARQLAEAETGLRPPRLHVGDLSVRRDLTDVGDVVAAYVLALERGQAGSAYNVCSGCVFTLREILEALIALTRLNVEVVIQPDRLRVQDLKVLMGSAQALRASTGWQATTPLSQTLGGLLSYWRERLRFGGQSSEPPEKQGV